MKQSAAFIVTLNVDDLNQLEQTAERIHDELDNSGFDVVEVKPWQHPTLGAAPEDAMLAGINLGQPQGQPPVTPGLGL